jgi:hypothetical protein
MEIASCRGRAYRKIRRAVNLSSRSSRSGHPVDIFHRLRLPEKCKTPWRLSREGKQSGDGWNDELYQEASAICDCPKTSREGLEADPDRRRDLLRFTSSCGAASDV